MRICFLGTGGSWPTRVRNVVSMALTHGRTTVLLDCGEGTQRQMIDSPVSPHRIDALLISHLHGDHFLGLPGLVQTMSLNSRDRPLKVFGPEGTAESVEKALTMTRFTPRFEIEARDLGDADLVRVGDLAVTCARSNHSIENLSYRLDTPVRPGRFDREKAISMGIPEGELWGRLQKGYSVEFTVGGSKRRVDPSEIVGTPRKGLSVVYSGDTAPCEQVIGLAKGADVLIHEATYSKRFDDIASEYGHSTSEGAAKVAKSAGVGRLYLVHTSPRYSEEDMSKELLLQAKAVFAETYLPGDGDCVDVNP